MAIRIQPHDITVPEDDPFKHDLLDRKKSVEVLTQLVRSFDGPCVLAVDAAWGNGKTTFLKMWQQYLRNLHFPVIDFNAWETDFAGSPFLALSTELTEELKKNKCLDENTLSKIKEKAKKVMKAVLPGFIRMMTAGALNIDPLLGKELGNALTSIAEDSFTEYESAKKSIEEFRSTLEDIAETVSKPKSNQEDIAEAVSQSSSGKPLIVMIDELDRCRPSYAVELLEIAKHFFSVNHIVFVLAINRSELAHSIKALYGRDFDALGYLRRFVDIDFRLPDPDRSSFIESAFERIELGKYFARTQDPNKEIDGQLILAMVQIFFQTSNLSLRQIGQAIQRLGLVFASLRSDQRSLTYFASVALIFRTIDGDLYHRFCKREIDDREAIESLFGKLWGAAPTTEGRTSMFEAIVIMGWCEMAHPDGVSYGEIDSPLFLFYKEISEQATGTNGANNRDIKYAKRVCRTVSLFCAKPLGGRGFVESVRRIELFSDGLMNEATSEGGGS